MIFDSVVYCTGDQNPDRRVIVIHFFVPVRIDSQDDSPTVHACLWCRVRR